VELPESLDECLKEVDVDGSGAVSFNEFVIFCKKIHLFEPEAIKIDLKHSNRLPKAETPEQYVDKVLERSGYNVLKAFRKYDTDNSSSISPSEFRKLVRDLGYRLTEREAELQVKLIATRGGISGQNEISFGEFKKVYIFDLFLILILMFLVSGFCRTIG
jgi:Ca2+-binding EF-hand superfamily protein